MGSEKIWSAIEKIADSRKLSVSGLAIQAGLNPTTFNKSKRVTSVGQERWPSTRTIHCILVAMDLTWDDFPSFISRDKIS